MNFNKYSLSLLSFISKTEGNENMRLQLFTACGIIDGIPVTIDDVKDDNQNTFLPNMLQYYKDDYKEEYNEEADTSSYILLQDVHIKNGTNTLNCPSMVVFINQIIGYTIGSLDR